MRIILILQMLYQYEREIYKEIESDLLNSLMKNNKELQQDC